MPPVAHQELQQLRDQLSTRLLAIRRAIRRRFLLEGVAWFSLGVVAAAALTLLVDWRLELTWPARATVLFVAFGAISWLLFRRLWQPLRLPLSPLDIAAAIDRTISGPASGQLSTRVASVLELPQAIDQPDVVSPDLVLHSVRKNFEELQDVSFARHLSRRHLGWCLAVLVSSIAIPAAFAMAAPSIASLWRDRWILGQERPWPHSTIIEVMGVQQGRLIVPRGETTGLQVKVTDRDQETEAVWMQLTSFDGSEQTVTLNRFAPGDFRLDLPPLQQPVDALIWGGDARAEPFRIDPLDRPRLTSLKLTATHPREPGPQTFDFTSDEGNIRLLPKTEVQIDFQTNVPVSEVRVIRDGEGPAAFVSSDRRHFSGNWTHEKQARLGLVLVSGDSGLESFPRPVAVGEKADRPPTVTLRHSGVRLRVTSQATIPVTATIRDDYGLRTGQLSSAIESAAAGADDAEATPDATPTGEPQPTASDNEPIKNDAAAPAKPRSATRTLFGPDSPAVEVSLEQQQNVEVSSLAAIPGQSLSVVATAEDDCFTGRQSASSRKITFRIVKDEELFREILLRQQQLRARLQKAYEQLLDLQEKMKVADAAVDGAQLLRPYLLTRREIAAVAREIDASLAEMRLNRLGGEESWRLIESSVTQPLARLQEQELERQKQGLETLLSSEPESMDSLIERQQAINDALRKILENMSQWDSFIDIINQVNSIIKIQEAARRMTEDLKSRQVESIFDN